MSPLERIVWVDIETTGLDHAKDIILEVAVVITTGNLHEVGAKSLVVKPASGLPALHPAVLAMHGLLSQLHAGCTLAAADTQLAALVHEHGACGGPIAGSSIHFDRRFIERDMPQLAACFSYRCFDVSTLKQAYVQATGAWVETGDAAHRAIDDIRYSIEVCRTVQAGLAYKGKGA